MLYVACLHTGSYVQVNTFVFVFSSGYVAVVGFISFAVCYRYGPLADEKSINLVSWTLQLFGLLLVYLGIQIQQVALAVILAVFFSKNLEYPVFLVAVACRWVLTGGGVRVQHNSELNSGIKQFVYCSTLVVLNKNVIDFQIFFIYIYLYIFSV